MTYVVLFSPDLVKQNGKNLCMKLKLKLDLGLCLGTSISLSWMKSKLTSIVTAMLEMQCLTTNFRNMLLISSPSFTTLSLDRSYRKFQTRASLYPDSESPRLWNIFLNVLVVFYGNTLFADSLFDLTAGNIMQKKLVPLIQIQCEQTISCESRNMASLRVCRYKFLLGLFEPTILEKVLLRIY